MIRKTRTVLTACLVLLMLALSTALTAAQQPLSPVREVTPPLQGRVKANHSVPLGDKLAVPDEVRTTMKFRQSLTADQQAAIHSVLDRHALDFQAIRERLPEQQLDTNLSAANKPSRQQQADQVTEGHVNTGATNNKLSVQLQRDTNLITTIGKAATQLKGLQDQVNREVNSLLSADQQVLFQQSVKPLQLAGAQTVAAINRDATVQGASQAFYGAYYGALAKYYGYYAYIYGYYDYVYSSSSDGYAYYDYLYNYYGYSYAYYGLKEIAAAYFDAQYTFGYDFNNTSDSAYSNFVNSNSYANYGSLYGYYSYYYYGSTYGYYGYYYGYYATTYAYYAYYYSYYT